MVPAKDVMFEKFEILQCLKKDDYGAVYLATHAYLSKRVILKVLDTHAALDESTVQRFKREAKIVARLEHPNIIKVMDLGVHGGLFHISFEYFESQNLRALLNQRRLSEEEKRHILVQMLHGLRYAHANGVIHRDIKPENILVNAALDVRISDFGLALTSTESHATNPQFLVGTPCQMSPEQVLGQKLTPQSDLFSLGIIAYEMFVGVHPFIGRDVNESLNNIVSLNEESLFETLRQVPEDIQTVIKGLLRKRPDDRWRDAGAVLEFLKASTQPDAVAARRSSPERWRVVAGIAAGAVVVTAVVFLFINNNRSDTDLSGGVSQDTAEQTTPRTTDSGIEALREQKQPAVSFAVREQNAIKTDASNPSARKASGANILPVSGVGLKGELYVECVPWAHVIVDSEQVETTPLSRSITLPVGMHEVQLVHPGYPTYKQRVNISASPTIVKVNLDTLFGYLQCDVSPWGEVLVNGASHGLTPMQRPIRLIPGEYAVTVRNDMLGKLEKNVTIVKGDTLRLKHTFEHF